VLFRSRRDEIGEMARAVIVFRNNAIELMKSRQTLAEQKLRLEEQLVRERQLTMRQRNFVSMASHEFRTPLTIIDGHARRLMKVGACGSTEDIVTRAEKIRQAALRMTASIEDLLSSSRLVDSEAKPFFRPAPIELVSLLQDVCKTQCDISPGRKIIEEFEASPLPMIGDQQLLKQAFGNLLSNAIKYSPRGSPIHVCTRRDGQWIAVEVRDQGIGIRQDELDHVFECYCRGSNVSSIVGTGIGLYLVRTIVHMHDGEVLVESKEGEGSLFVVRFPEERKGHRRTPLEAELA
jgi:two-component system OmpR family sensor kinase